MILCLVNGVRQTFDVVMKQSLNDDTKLRSLPTYVDVVSDSHITPMICGDCRNQRTGAQIIELFTVGYGGVPCLYSPLKLSEPSGQHKERNYKGRRTDFKPYSALSDCSSSDKYRGITRQYLA